MRRFSGNNPIIAVIRSVDKSLEGLFQPLVYAWAIGTITFENCLCGPPPYIVGGTPDGRAKKSVRPAQVVEIEI